MNKILNSLSLELLNLLNLHKLKIGTAESCTGGMLAQYLTMHPGSSNAYKYSFITYSNEAKVNMLNIKQKLLEDFGAVSKEVVCDMARNMINYNNDIDIVLAISGIAGPGGALPNKPVGLVHHALATKKAVKHERIIYKGNRETVRKLSVKTCLEMALNEIN
tara:strand:+ start:223 stop:708 length:486 start_codon:yes stop_codon:yes gene_type:complete